MKLNRRGALMSIIGGIFGGPDAAKSVLKVDMGDAYLKGGHMVGRGPEALGDLSEGPMTGTEDFRLNQIKNTKDRIDKLSKFLNGELAPWQDKQLKDFSGFVERKRMFEIDNMKSLSPTAKLHMVDRQHKEYMLNNWRNDAKEEIENLTSWLDRFEKGFKVVDKMFAGASEKTERAWNETQYDKPSPPKAQKW